MGDTIFKKKGRPLSKVTKTHIDWAKTYELPKLEALRLAGRDSIQDTGEGSWLGIKTAAIQRPVASVN
jgi:hypothetical protein